MPFAIYALLPHAFFNFHSLLCGWIVLAVAVVAQLLFYFLELQNPHLMEWLTWPLLLLLLLLLCIHFVYLYFIHVVRSIFRSLIKNFVARVECPKKWSYTSKNWKLLFYVNILRTFSISRSELLSNCQTRVSRWILSNMNILFTHFMALQNTCTRIQLKPFSVWVFYEFRCFFGFFLAKFLPSRRSRCSQ